MFHADSHPLKSGTKSGTETPKCPAQVSRLSQYCPAWDTFGQSSEYFGKKAGQSRDSKRDVPVFRAGGTPSLEVSPPGQGRMGGRDNG